MINDEQLHKWVNGQLSKEELELFKLRPEYESLVDLYKNTEDLVAPNFDEQAMLTEILKQENKVSKPNAGRRIAISRWVKYGIAASVLLLVTWMIWPNNSLVKYELAKGERKEGILPDESTFILNAESDLSFNPKTWKSLREVDLKGEAFFKVEKGSKFEVKTPTGSVQVLGTQFNVRSRNNILEVNCRSGKVAILSTNGKVLEELNPNDMVRIENNQVVKKWQEESSNQQLWTEGIFNFKEVTLAVVLAELERQFNIPIDATKVDTKEIITCNFQNKNLELALKTSLSPLGIKCEFKSDNTIVLVK